MGKSKQFPQNNNDSVKSDVKDCACGCKEKVSSTRFYANTPSGKVASGDCLKRYEKSHKTVYAPPSSPVPNPSS